ncbi:MAG: 1-deoxy-D-xylulose-5-phosphate synthase [Streptosporangiales bacterium]
MSVLASIQGPDDVKRLDGAELGELAAEIRELLVSEVSRTGGHLGPNLGVVELTIALHRVFSSPRDRILFDVGHQAYVHKMLTGRQAGFRDGTLRHRGGLSGYPNQAESDHDTIENSHASPALSYADGLATAYQLRGEIDRRVVAVVGDGALTGGMAWEALNNIAASKDRGLVIVVNDNGRSYSPTHGALASHLTTLRTNPHYEQVLALVKESLSRTPLVGAPLYDALHGVKRGLKDALSPQGMFEDLGLKYVGPVDGHDVAAVEVALRNAERFGGPVIVHCVTQKGRGYQPAEDDEQDCLHQVRSTQPTGWTDVFSDELCSIATRRNDVVGVTAAMLHPTGLAPVAERFPDRVYDVGIAEQHAVTKAAGLALGGLHPVVAVYATFRNRAVDQVLMDVALHRLPVTFMLDRAGVTGDDGPSHNGMWDLSVLQVVPGLRIAAPRDGGRLREQLREAVDVTDGPTALRYPKGPVGADIDAVERVGTTDVLLRSEGAEVLLVAVGAMAGLGLEAAQRLAAEGVAVTVVDPRWVKPVDASLVALAGEHAMVAVVEDNGRAGGVGAALSQALQDADCDTPVRTFGLPQRFLEHAKRAEILQDVGLTADDLARAILTGYAAFTVTGTLEAIES